MLNLPTPIWVFLRRREITTCCKHRRYGEARPGHISSDELRIMSLGNTGARATLCFQNAPIFTGLTVSYVRHNPLLPLAVWQADSALLRTRRRVPCSCTVSISKMPISLSPRTGWKSPASHDMRARFASWGHRVRATAAEAPPPPSPPRKSRRQTGTPWRDIPVRKTRGQQ